MARNKKGRFAKPKEVERLARFGEAARKRRLGSPNDGASDSTEPEAGDQAESYQLEGRRIVNLGLLAKQLDESGCMACHTPLHLSDTEGSHRYGCAEVLLIKCRACEVMTPVHTSKRHYSPSSGKLMPIYDINTKIASGMQFLCNATVVMTSIYSVSNIVYIWLVTPVKRCVIYIISVTANWDSWHKVTDLWQTKSLNDSYQRVCI